MCYMNKDFLNAHKSGIYLICLAILTKISTCIQTFHLIINLYEFLNFNKNILNKKER